MGELCKKAGGPILKIYTLYDVFLLLLSGGRDDCACVKIFSGVNFLIAINSLMHLLMAQCGSRGCK